MRTRTTATIVALALAVACVTAPRNDPAPPPADPPRGYRFESLRLDNGNTDRVLVCVCLSGGGTRAAALALGVLEELRDTRVGEGPYARRLLDEVDVVSTVSGGSFTGAFHALHRDATFQELGPRMLERSLQGEIARALLWKVWKTASPWFDRSDVAAEIYDRSVFDRATYARLVERGTRPFLVVNATDLATGHPFAFTQEQFDQLGSRLDTFPIARAVASSAALPVAFSAITVRNHGGGRTPAGVTDALARGDQDPRLRRWAEGQARYTAPDRPAFVHLTDGGVSDNLGVRSLWADLRRSDGSLRRLIERRRVEHLVFVIANAEKDPSPWVKDEANAPNISATASAVVPSMIGNYNFESIRLLEEEPILDAFLKDHGVAKHVIEVDLRRVPDEAERRRLLALPTSLSLPAPDVRSVIDAGRQVLRDHPRYRELVNALGR